MATPLNSASFKQLKFVDAERQWSQGEKPYVARPEQLIPFEGWSRCLAMAGRGWGKTKTGASWVRRMAGLYPGSITHIVAPTYSDLRGVIFEGPSGLRATIPADCIASMSYSPYPEMVLWNGSIIRGFSSETPDRLRGPQATFVWGDELAAWYKAEECLSNIDFSTRIAYRTADGRLIQPQKLYTTTPRPLAFINKMIKEGVKLIRGSTYDNRDNLADEFFKELEKYEGTELGRQELHGELLDISESAIIKKSWLRMWPGDQPLPWFEYIIVSLDTAFTEKTFNKKTFASDPTACTVWGVFKHDRRWNVLLIDCWSEWLGFPDLLVRARKEMKTVYGRKESPLFEAPLVGKTFLHHQVKRPDLLVIEEKGSGISLRQVMEKESVPAMAYNPGHADKMQRLHLVSYLPKAGRVWLPEGRRRDKLTNAMDSTGKFANWTDELLEELCVYSGPGTTPHDDWVDSCLRNTTLIRMGDGSKRRIDQVQVGDEVATPLGPRRVLQAGATGVQSLQRLEWGSGYLEGTGNHPVWADGDWRSLDSLSQGSIVQEWHSPENLTSEWRRLSSTAIDTIVTPIPQAPRIVATSGGQVTVFIETCGNFIRDLFLRAMTFIITTTTQATTTSRTSAACLRQSTEHAIESRMLRGERVLSNWSTWLEFERNRRRGTVARKGSSGTVNTLKRASNALALLLSPKRKGIAESVFGAGRVIGQSPIPESSAIVRAKPQNLGIAEKVYNLRVEEAECYYANDILVHNCSQAWRVFADLFLPGGIDKDAPPVPGAREAAEAILEPTALIEQDEHEYQHQFDQEYEPAEARRGMYD